ncbi:MAG: DUF86 domain-containing protein [Gammaproteobacteria bacterium]
MGDAQREVIERKLAFLRQFLQDLAGYARLDANRRRREHYAVERLLQLLCESAADIALQRLKALGYALPTSYREIFIALQQSGHMPADMASDLVAACGMRNVLTHLYDTIDLDRVVAAVDPALELYRRFLEWALQALQRREF